MDTVKESENTPPDSRTPLAILGQPANSSTDNNIRVKTCEVEGSREASTIEADSAEVRDKDDESLPSTRSPSQQLCRSVRLGTPIGVVLQ